MKTYAILDENNICIAQTEQTELVNKPDNYIEIEKGQDVLWRKYINGVFSDEKYEPPKSYEQIKSEYIAKIQEAEILGDTEEVTRLRGEWQQLKIDNGW